MAEDFTDDDSAKFLIPDSPLEVKLSIHHDKPPSLQITVGGPKRNEHKDPRYAKVITHLFDELKSYISMSGLFPVQGRLMMDPYPDEDISLYVRYPAGPPAHQATTLADKLIRNPGRLKKNKKNSEKLFGILSDKMPVFIKDLKPILERERFSYQRHTGNSGPKRPQVPTIDPETKEAYDLLGVKPDMPWPEIKKMFYDKARKAHPDAKGGVDDGSFQKIHNAYELIKKLQQKSGK